MRCRGTSNVLIVVVVIIIIIIITTGFPLNMMNALSRGWLDIRRRIHFIIVVFSDSKYFIIRRSSWYILLLLLLKPKSFSVRWVRKPSTHRRILDQVLATRWEIFWSCHAISTICPHMYLLLFLWFIIINPLESLFKLLKSPFYGLLVFLFDSTLTLILIEDVLRQHIGVIVIINILILHLLRWCLMCRWCYGSCSIAMRRCDLFLLQD